MRAAARLLSRAVGVEWAGWRTDTHTLQQNGWEIAVDVNHPLMAYQLMMRHQSIGLYAITAQETVDWAITDPSFDPRRVPVFRVRSVSPRIQFVKYPVMGPMNWQQVDAMPRMTTEEITRVEDMNIFSIPLTRAEEVLMDRADMTVIEHLEAIKRLQSDKQRELRERTRSSAIVLDGCAPSRAALSSNVIVNLVEYREAS